MASVLMPDAKPEIPVPGVKLMELLELDEPDEPPINEPTYVISSPPFSLTGGDEVPLHPRQDIESAQEFEHKLRLLVGLRQHGHRRLLQHAVLRELRHFRSHVGIGNAGLG